MRLLGEGIARTMRFIVLGQQGAAHALAARAQICLDVVLPLLIKIHLAHDELDGHVCVVGLELAVEPVVFVSVRPFFISMRW